MRYTHIKLMLIVAIRFVSEYTIENIFKFHLKSSKMTRWT